jgi:hypothetical protein
MNEKSKKVRKSKEQLFQEKLKREQLLELIIVKVSQHPKLWDRQNPEYLNPREKAASWESIAAETKCKLLIIYFDIIS